MILPARRADAEDQWEYFLPVRAALRVEEKAL